MYGTREYEAKSRFTILEKRIIILKTFKLVGAFLPFNKRSNWDISDIVNRVSGLVGRVFTNGPGDLGSIPGRVIPKTLKMALDTSLLNSQQYKVRIKGKVE